MLSWPAHVQAWSAPPVDDVGYIPAPDLLALGDGDLLALTQRMAGTRYGGWRNYAGRWRDALGLDDPGRGQRVLDFGCGVGIEAVELARAGYQVALADLAEVNLALAVRVLALHGFAPWATCVVTGQPPYLVAPDAGTLDVFYAAGVLHHIPWARQIMQRAHGLLRAGGEARLMLYSGEGWRLATGTEPPDDTAAHPLFGRFVRFFDAVGDYADWYDGDKLQRMCGDLFTLRRLDYLTPDRRYLAAVLCRR